ncbi:hypothetical protein MCOR31_010613 [Pyricularia oryzae]|nr:hypothetical protein MCOR31_010613 [Pyricularia oryzae]
MEELLSTFLVAHLFRDFPEFYKGIMRAQEAELSPKPYTPGKNHRRMDGQLTQLRNSSQTNAAKVSVGGNGDGP